MFKKTTTALGLFLLMFFGPGILSAQSLSDTLRNAYTTSGLLVQNRALLRAADEDMSGSMALLRPVINWSSTYSYTGASASDKTSLSGSLSANWLLYDFGRSKTKTEALKETVLATRQSLMSIEQDVLLRGVSAHMNYRRTVEFALLRSTNVELIFQELSAAQDRFDVGEVTRTDVALAEARLASARASLSGAEGNRLRASAEYQAVTGKLPKDLGTPVELPALPENVEMGIAQARMQHPDLKRMRHTVNAAELRIKIANAADQFSVSGRAGLAVNDSGSGVSESVSITVSGPIYSGGANASGVRAAMARRDSTRAQSHIASLSMEQEVRNSFVLFNVARASGEATERQVKAAEVAFRGIREEASLGARTTLDVLNAEQELLDARASSISAGIDEQIAAYTVLASIGKLNAVSLGLGLKTYDPIEYYNFVKTGPRAKSTEGTVLDNLLKNLVEN